MPYNEPKDPLWKFSDSNKSSPEVLMDLKEPMSLIFHVGKDSLSDTSKAFFAPKWYYENRTHV
jgi:hypothetical protein